MSSSKTDLGSGNVRSLLLKLAIPAVVAQVINLLYNIVDRIYIGHIPVVGTSALTGGVLCLPRLMLINARCRRCTARCDFHGSGQKG